MTTPNQHTERMKKAGHPPNGGPAVVLSSGLLSGGDIAALRLGGWLILLRRLDVSSAQDPFKHAQGDHGYLGLIAPGQNDGLPEDAHFSGKFSEIRAGFRDAEVAKVGQLHALSIQERWIVQFEREGRPTSCQTPTHLQRPPGAGTKTEPAFALTHFLSKRRTWSSPCGTNPQRQAGVLVGQIDRSGVS